MDNKNQNNALEEQRRKIEEMKKKELVEDFAKQKSKIFDTTIKKIGPSFWTTQTYGDMLKGYPQQKEVTLNLENMYLSLLKGAKSKDELTILLIFILEAILEASNPKKDVHLITSETGVEEGMRAEKETGLRGYRSYESGDRTRFKRLATFIENSDLNLIDGSTPALDKLWKKHQTLVSEHYESMKQACYNKAKSDKEYEDKKRKEKALEMGCTAIGLIVILFFGLIFIGMAA